jgi:hypothetical protein
MQHWLIGNIDIFLSAVAILPCQHDAADIPPRPQYHIALCTLQPLLMLLGGYKSSALSLQCAAFDVTDSIIAAGDASGRILLWHDFPKALAQWASGTSSSSSNAAAISTTAALAAAAIEEAAGFTSAAEGNAVRLPACTTVHWHAHAVGALCFSMDGSQLLSGGQEGVLVSSAAAVAVCCLFMLLAQGWV